MDKPVTIWFAAYPAKGLDPKQAAEDLLSSFEAEPRLAPLTSGPGEKSRNPYDHAQVVADILAKPDARMYMHRSQTIKYVAYFNFGDYSYCSVDFDKSLSASNWRMVESLADRLAAAIEPRFAVLHIFRPTPLKWNNEEEKIQSWMNYAAQPIPAQFRDNGPMGVAMRTYFGGDVKDMFGEDLLLGAPAIVSKLDWGGIRLDLDPDLWNDDVPKWSQQAKRVWDYLQPAQALAQPVFQPEYGNVEFLPSEKWKSRAR